MFKAMAESTSFALRTVTGKVFYGFAVEAFLFSVAGRHVFRAFATCRRLSKVSNSNHFAPKTYVGWYIIVEFYSDVAYAIFDVCVGIPASSHANDLSKAGE